MKILTWNVNGLRAVLGKGGWAEVAALAPDVVCLQEIKVRPSQLSEGQLATFEGYHPAWNPAEKAGYSGVATFSRPVPLEVELGMGSEGFESEGRVIQSRYPGFRLFNIYFPNGQRDHGRLQYKLNFYAHLLSLCDRLHEAGEQIVICGDFNTAHQEIDLRNPKSNANTSGFLPEERAWLDTYLAHGFVDAYRSLYPSRVQYTWWTYTSNARPRNVGWRLDFFMVSAGLMGRVRDVAIHDEVMGSDHCPVVLDLGD